MHINIAYQQFISSALQNHDEREAKQIAKILLLDIFDITNPNAQGKIPKEVVQNICFRLSQNEPVQYITGVSFFYELPFHVNSNVLIPRPETEELVYQILNDPLFCNKKNVSILDIGTGSGCIPISIAHQRPSWDISATDVSIEALSVATINDKEHHTGVTFIHNDILDRNTWTTLPKVDIIVSNPPYIIEEEKKIMPQHVLKWEPHLALFSGTSALLFYETIADFALSHLSPTGLIYFEINEFHSHSIRDMLHRKGFHSTTILKDMSNADRMIRACKNI